MSDKMREAFEKWAISQGFDISRCATDAFQEFYNFDSTAFAWEAWQAAQSEQSAELERLRKDAERYHYIRKMGLREAGFKENRILFDAQDEAIDAAIAAEGEKE